ncbi:hypothetical protein Unana1_00373 [Umbelopsis nana]
MSFSNIFHHHSKHSHPSSPQVQSTEDLHKTDGHGHEDSSAHKGTDSPKRTDSPHQADTPRRTDSPKVLAKFLADPFRSTASPDHLGEFVDPMGGSISHDSGNDPMSTGA